MRTDHDFSLQALENIRSHILTLTDDLLMDQFNIVPTGYSNNIIWNMGHLIASQQGLCYLRSGLKPLVAEELYSPFKFGTKPTKDFGTTEIGEIKKLLISTIKQLKVDYENHSFLRYTATMTMWGVQINDISDVIQFLLIHEGFHLGYITALKKALISNY